MRFERSSPMVGAAVLAAVTAASLPCREPEEHSVPGEAHTDIARAAQQGGPGQGQSKGKGKGKGEKGSSLTEALRARPMPVPRSLVKPRGETRIHIDGSLQDWPAAPPLLMDDTRQVSGTALGSYRGKDDVAGRVFLLWDEEDLFVSAAVRDDWHRTLTADSPRLLEIPPADSLMLTIDPKRDTRSIGRDEGRVDDREFWLAGVEGQGRRLVLWDRLRGLAHFAEGAVAVVVHDRDRWLTTYEARIPWKQILPVGVKPAIGKVLRLQIVINDYDALTDAIAQTRVGWTFGTGPRIDPGLFGSVMLSGPLDERVEKLPEFPPGPELRGDPVPDAKYWVQFYEKLRRTAPAVVTAEGGAPEDAGGTERGARLAELEHHVATFPRVDHLEFHHRVQRRMRREIAGMTRTGLFFLWQHVLTDVARRMTRRAAEGPPARGFRLYRLPAGGWLVRSGAGSFAIDPAGPDLAHHLWGALGFVVLTNPTDVTKRSDQLLVRLLSAKRPFSTHRIIHLPGVDGSKLPLVEIGKSYPPPDADSPGLPRQGVRVHVLGRASGDAVTPTVGYVVLWPDGSVLVHSGESATPESVAAALPDGSRVDVLLLSARHPHAAELGRKVGARLTVLDDVLHCATRAGPRGRVSLEQAFALQRALLPSPSSLVALGEVVEMPSQK